jgi:hypothetical protein
MQQERIMIVIEAQTQEDLLARIVRLFHRLNVEIQAFSMVRSQRPEKMRLSVATRVEREHRSASLQSGSSLGCENGRRVIDFQRTKTPVSSEFANRLLAPR